MIRAGSLYPRKTLELFLESASPEKVKQRLHEEVHATQVEVIVGSVLGRN